MAAWRLKSVRDPLAASAKLSAAESRSQRMSNRKFRAATGWVPHYPSAREGFTATLAALASAHPGEPHLASPRPS